MTPLRCQRFAGWTMRGYDSGDIERAAERPGHCARELRKPHDNEFGENWRWES
jgi:hypothetical protein